MGLGFEGSGITGFRGVRVQGLLGLGVKVQGLLGSGFRVQGLLDVGAQELFSVFQKDAEGDYSGFSESR